MSIVLELEDLRLPIIAAIDPDGLLVFARALATGEEARGLRHAIQKGHPGTLRAEDGKRYDIFLDPDTRIREERIWIKGIPKTRVTAYLPGARGWWFWVGPSDFYAFVEAVTDLPVPAPERRMKEAGTALRILAGLRGPDGDPPLPVRDLARAEGRRRPEEVLDSLRAIREGLRPLISFRLPEDWTALAIHEKALLQILPAVRK